MKLLTILPIARGIRTETLTYFSSENISIGEIVSVPIRKKRYPGIIIGSQNAEEAKSEIKEMPFAIKKIIRHSSDVALPIWLMNAGRKIADESAGNIGAVLAALLPKAVLEDPELFFKNGSDQSQAKHTGRFDVLAIQSANADRFDMYKTIIRESFAKKMSVAVICPTEESVAQIEATLSKGIEKHAFSTTNTKAKKKLSLFAEQARDTSRSNLIIGTASIIGLLPLSVGTIILEEESSPFYKQRRRPFLDIRQNSIEAARAMDARIILGDRLLSIETQAKIKEGKTNEYSRLARRSFHKIQTLLVDIKQKDDEKTRLPTPERSNGGQETVFQTISPELEEMIVYTEKSKKKLFVYSARRGISAQTVCKDCGTTVLCDRCEAPAVLHTQSCDKKFICHHCGATRSALEQCKNCQSWNLTSYGVGIERIEEDIKKISDTNIIRIDSDVCKTAKEAQTRINKFLSLPSGILVGTDMALRLLPDVSVDFTAIPSLDSLASLPDFRTSERMMHTMLDVKAKARECMLVQTRNTENKIIEYALSGDLEGFAKDEIKARKEFGYPPFMKIVKLTVAGKKDVVKLDAQRVKTLLEKYNPTIFPAFIKTIKDETLLHIMIKIPARDWPDKNLSEILLSLPPSVRIDTSPQSLL